MVRKRTRSIRAVADEISAAEAVESTTTRKKKKATRKKATRTRKTREKVAQRKRLVWGIFSGSMKEEARFPYDQRAAAEEKLEQLRGKSKKMYFLQPIKEVMADAPIEADSDSDDDGGEEE